ncbi:hypothetical protein HL666_11565 [Bradyrhizobium sp. 83002]|uniref:DUF6894 family protein n=1 Tax=Bradyrhizobium aeschynomenes TaxID=2734909 RepID=UPI001556FD3F|nr:hypothetical protein [Bradyrhizobium aeschynomenes]NPU11398.1 hypothetical protein [Bradyrhizobium aeschynomenes]
MPQFYFNYSSGGTTFTDDVGTDFASLEAAYLDACETALAIAFEKLRARQDPATDAFDIVDVDRNVLMQLPFSEVLRPGTGTIMPWSMLQTTSALENCSRERARGERLKSELGAELARTREIFAAIRANVPTRHPS